MKSNTVRPLRNPSVGTTITYISCIIELKTIGIYNLTDVADQCISLHAFWAETISIKSAVRVDAHWRQNALSLLKHVSWNTAETNSCIWVISSTKDVDELAASVFDIISIDAFCAGYSSHCIAVWNVDAGSYDAGLLGKRVSLITCFAGSWGHVAGLTKRVKFLAFSIAGLQEKSISAVDAESSLSGNAVGIIIGTGGLCADDTGTLSQGVSIIARGTLVLSRSVSFAERITFDTSILDSKEVSLIATCASATIISSLTIRISIDWWTWTNNTIIIEKFISSVTWQTGSC